ncbi:hypothetical protein CPB85DRAFT_1459947 [Mucidula mucida]|nr:hypothetical protein CPB85DRAFT_1459947 [Mucidula mucida]
MLLNIAPVRHLRPPTLSTTGLRRQLELERRSALLRLRNLICSEQTRSSPALVNRNVIAQALRISVLALLLGCTFQTRRSSSES